jgi:DNA-binding HxlR family transcriptional regulator
VFALRSVQDESHRVESGSGAGFSTGEVRSGGKVLSVLENPLNTRVLRAHTEGPQRLAELQEKVGWSAQTTVRAALGGLVEIGALSKRRVSNTPYAVATELTDVGTEMIWVAEVLEAWLARCPDGPIATDGEEAKVAVKALSGGWSTALMRALVAGTFSLTELHSLMPHISYPALERRISWMKETGQIRPAEREGRGTPYTVTDWLRQAMAPLSAAGRCERRHMESESGPVTSIEVETAFLLTVPLGPVPPDANGSCMFVVKTDAVDPSDEKFPLAGVLAKVESGEIVSVQADVRNAAPATWAVGTADDWLEAVIDGRIESLRIGGADPQLCADLVQGIHFALFVDR